VLNLDNSVPIVTIDEPEVYRLRLLLEQPTTPTSPRC